MLMISLNHSTLQVQVNLYTANREPSPDPGGRCRAEGVTDEGVHAFMQQALFLSIKHSAVPEAGYCSGSQTLPLRGRKTASPCRIKEIVQLSGFGHAAAFIDGRSIPWQSFRGAGTTDAGRKTAPFKPIAAPRKFLSYSRSSRRRKRDEAAHSGQNRTGSQ